MVFITRQGLIDLLAAPVRRAMEMINAKVIVAFCSAGVDTCTKKVDQTRHRAPPPPPKNKTVIFHIHVRILVGRCKEPVARPLSVAEEIYKVRNA